MGVLPPGLAQGEVEYKKIAALNRCEILPSSHEDLASSAVCASQVNRWLAWNAGFVGLCRPVGRSAPRVPRACEGGGPRAADVITPMD